jgi:OmpA-OmpF porin, OOP family
MIRNAGLVLLLGLFNAGWASALELPRNGTLVAEQNSELDLYAVPLGPVTYGQFPLSTERGKIGRRVWQIPQTDLTALQLFESLRDQISETFGEPVFDCKDRVCGGFDFRFAIEVVEAPAMYVDLGNYFFATFRSSTGDRHATLMVSKGGTTGYVQLIEISEAADDALNISVDTDPPAPTGLRAPVTDIGKKLTNLGATVLGDLVFGSGADTLDETPFASLQQLAEFLVANPDASVILVGHTDAVGSLEANIDLSERRANAVRQRLIDRFDVQPTRIEAQGVGYLAPRATNTTEDGRRINRRVEVVLTAPLQ